MFYVWCLISFAVHACVSAGTTTAKAGCEYKGVWHPFGETFKPSPCEFCRCSTISGTAACGIIDCPALTFACAKPVYHSGQCCPTCDDALKCWYGNQLLTLKPGEEAHVKKGTACSCPSNLLHTIGLNGNKAICRSTVS